MFIFILNVSNVLFFFDEINVNDFFEKFDNVVIDKNLNKKNKCVRLINYCSFKIKIYIEYLFKFVNRN